MNQSSSSVLLLHEAIGPDARPDEMDALVQVEQISHAMQTLGWRVSALPTDLNLAATLSSIRECNPTCVFNLVESLAGDGRMIHYIPSLLRLAMVPFTGSGSDAVYLSTQKLLAKEFMRLNDIPTPPCFVAGAEPGDDKKTWIVKSVWEHASYGMDDGCVVTGARAARARMNECTERLGGDWFAEQFVDGREFNIAVLEQNGQACILPVAEMTFVDYPRGKPKFVGYAAKWDESAPEYHATQRAFPHLTEITREALLRIARRCWTVFGLQGYARIDIRLDSAGIPWVLEINANPCLSRDAGFAAAALEGGISYEQLIEQVVHAALQPALPVLRRAGPSKNFSRQDISRAVAPV
jgi:D-alanine-D-alanine ligase